jgi:hypothetical protein
MPNYWPTAWVIQDASLPDSVPARRAWKELSARRNAGKLSGVSEQKVTDLALAELAKPPGSHGPLHNEMTEHLADLVCDGKLSAAEIDSFFQRIAWQSLKVRPVVLQGNGLQYEAEGDTCWRGSAGWMCYQVFVGVLVDGTPGYKATMWSGPLSAQPAGEHTVSGSWDYKLFRPGAVSPAWTRTVTLRAQVQVVTDLSTEGLIELDRPELLGTIRSAIKAKLVEARSLNFDAFGGTRKELQWLAPLSPLSRSSMVVASLSAGNLPCSIAFDVYVRDGSHEHYLGTISLAKGRSGDFTPGVVCLTRSRC